MQTVGLFVYRFSPSTFEPYGDPVDPHAYVSREPVDPLGPPEPVGDLLALHEQAGIELRIVSALLPWWDVVRSTSVGFSAIRLRNARPATRGAT